ncbi:ferredoxin domain-containing protein [Clostridiisalibacter paucivorans]|uniref:ferredoxin domain-containing protein n=1 Tax=Clostridiisalibacter paucivorans TaxID=408753 RepID=UPI00047CD65E|nr:DUF2148 domain-containing protein [Clostridiisalibacter paucivorans]
MFYNSEDIEKNTIIDVAQKMCVAARTAPKGKGIDNILTTILTDAEKDELADHMERIGKDKGIDFFIRDAQNVRHAAALVLIGSELNTRGIEYCGFCGFENCKEKNEKKGRCAFDITDLGIAVGSAVSIAADNRVDNRVMFSVGKVALEVNTMGNNAGIIYGIPLTTKGKSIFFDRK